MIIGGVFETEMVHLRYSPADGVEHRIKIKQA